MSKFRLFSTFQEVLFLILHPWVVFRERLSETTIDPDPFVQFRRWYKSSLLMLSTEFPNAMCLSTVGVDGRAEGRMVLLKQFDEKGFVFYTNLQSRKGESLKAHPEAALTFYWGPAQRQVRVQGHVELIDDAVADRYFASRPRRSQIGAWASAQSRMLESREILDEKFDEYSRKFKEQKVLRPPYWSGFRLIPDRIEFWQLRLNRLHDRFLYVRGETGGWTICRLYP